MISKSLAANQSAWYAGRMVLSLGEKINLTKFIEQCTLANQILKLSPLEQNLQHGPSPFAKHRETQTKGSSSS